MGGTASQVSGPGIDTNVWSARTLFLFQDASGAGAGQPPAADFTASCTSLTCDFDASVDGPRRHDHVVRLDLRRRQHGHRRPTSHDYAAAGTRG